MNAKWAGGLIEGDDKSDKHRNEESLIGETFCVLFLVYPREGMIHVANLILCVGRNELRSDRWICWKEQVWAKASDDKRNEKGEVVEGLSVVICLLYPKEGIINVGCG